MDECIERGRVLEILKDLVDGIKDVPKDAFGECTKNYIDGWRDGVETGIDEIEVLPAADVRPERHGYVVWKERRSGGFRHRECLCDHGVFLPPCNKIATIDDRCTENRPYCSECGKLLGDFLSYCGNCGAKMDGEK